MAVVIGAEHQKLGRLHHIGLIARQHGQLLTRLGLADSHNTGHLQKARGRGGLGGGEDGIQLLRGNRLGSELTNGAMGKDKIDGLIHGTSKMR